MAGPDADDRERRLAFAIPPIKLPPDDLVIEWLDPADPDDRSVLLRAAHPELDVAAESQLVDGREINPRLHLAIHEVVAGQLASGEPPEVWATAKRLSGLGYDRHEVLHMLGSAVSGELWQALQGHRGYDLEAHRAAQPAPLSSDSIGAPADARRARHPASRTSAIVNSAAMRSRDERLDRRAWRPAPARPCRRAHPRPLSRMTNPANAL